jgi:hypothetical protein
MKSTMAFEAWCNLEARASSLTGNELDAFLMHVEREEGDVFFHGERHRHAMLESLGRGDLSKAQAYGATMKWSTKDASSLEVDEESTLMEDTREIDRKRLQVRPTPFVDGDYVPPPAAPSSTRDVGETALQKAFDPSLVLPFKPKR